MRKLSRSALIGAVAASVVWAAALSVYAQVKRPYRDGSVWNISMIRVKPGMDTAYLNYLAADWKRNQEAHLAALEANEDKSDAILQRVIGDDQKQMQGYRDRSEIREVLGGRLAREIVLEPRP